MVVDSNEALPLVPRRPTNRLRSLDGLRGIAALIVVGYHVALTNAAIAGAYLNGRPESLGPAEFLFFNTPLQILWAGREAVLIFFVLSGFVLSIGPSRGTLIRWTAYYPERILRLYLPSLASILFAVGTTFVVARELVPGGSEWLNQHVLDGNIWIKAMVAGTLMVGDGNLNTPLWSLKWEVLFSLALPAYLLVARRLRPIALPAVGVFALLSAAGMAFDLGPLTYLPVFGVGVAMAYASEDLIRAASRINRTGWIGLAAVALILITNSATLGLFVDQPMDYRAVSTGVSVLGAGLGVFLSAWCPVAIRGLTTRPVLWLGRISFSLYLIHEPIVVAVAFATNGSLATWQTYLISLPLALILSEVFYRGIERPSHLFSRWVGRTVSSTKARRSSGESAVPSPGA